MFCHTSFYAFRNIYFHLERYGQVMHLAGQYVSRDQMREYPQFGLEIRYYAREPAQVNGGDQAIHHWVKKEEALDLPEKIDEVREVELNAKEQKAYDEMRDFLITEIEGEEITAQVALAKLMKLRQATAGFFYSETHEAVEIGTRRSSKSLRKFWRISGPSQSSSGFSSITRSEL